MSRASVLMAVPLLVATLFDAHTGIGRGSPAAPAVTGLDHIPVAVADLERAAGAFRELGFALKPGRPHANGIRNQHVKFPDGTELELITAPEARDRLTATYRRHLLDGDGPAFLAFYAPSLDAAAAAMDAARIPYERRAGFLGLPHDQVLNYVFLAGRNQSPTDRPEHFDHPNGAESLIGVWLSAEDLSEERRLLTTLGATFSDDLVWVPDAVRASVAHLAEGEVVFLPDSRQLTRGRRIAGATIRVRNAATARRLLGRHAVIPPDRSTSVFVRPSSAHGIWLEFRAAR
jgi:hypothetical protein